MSISRHPARRQPHRQPLLRQQQLLPQRQHRQRQQRLLQLQQLRQQLRLRPRRQQHQLRQLPRLRQRQLPRLQHQLPATDRYCDFYGYANIDAYGYSYCDHDTDTGLLRHQGELRSQGLGQTPPPHLARWS